MIFEHYDLLEQRVAEGYVSKQKHPTGDLYIYNYKPRAQYDQKWDRYRETIFKMIQPEYSKAFLNDVEV
jgi:hypothetical protein